MGDPISFYGQLFEGTAITPAIKRAARKTLDYGLTAIRTRTPVDTGLLKSSWTGRLEGYGVRIDNSTPYGIYVEMGTRKMPARPMVGATYPEMVKKFRTYLGKEIGSRAAGKLQGAKSLQDVVSVSTASKGTAEADSKFSQLTTPDRYTSKGFRPGVGGRPAQQVSKRTIEQLRRDFKREFSSSRGKGFGK
jgi:HK97 gp10 family phage protein